MTLKAGASSSARVRLNSYSVLPRELIAPGRSGECPISRVTEEGLPQIERASVEDNGVIKKMTDAIALSE
jgi:hypothetical protein